MGLMGKAKKWAGAAALMAMVAGPASADQQLAIGATSAASPFYGYFVAVSNIINDHVEGVTSKVVESGAAIENLKRIGRGQLDMGLITTNSLADAYNGAGPFDGAPIESKLLWVYFTAPQMTLVRRDSDIERFSDLDGQRFHTGQRGSSTEATTDMVFATLGVAPDVFRGGSQDANNAFKDNRIVGITGSSMGTSLNAGQIDLNSTIGLKPVGLTFEEADLIRENHPQLSIIDVPEGAGDGIPAFTTWAFALGASVGPGISEEVGYQIVRAVMEHRQPQTDAMRPTGNVDFLTATVQYATSPLHPGAIRYLREQGVEVPNALIAPEDR